MPSLFLKHAQDHPPAPVAQPLPTHSPLWPSVPLFSLFALLLPREEETHGSLGVWDQEETQLLCANTPQSRCLDSEDGARPGGRVGLPLADSPEGQVPQITRLSPSFAPWEWPALGVILPLPQLPYQLSVPSMCREDQTSHRAQIATDGREQHLVRWTQTPRVTCVMTHQSSPADDREMQKPSLGHKAVELLCCGPSRVGGICLLIQQKGPLRGTCISPALPFRSLSLHSLSDWTAAAALRCTSLLGSADLLGGPALLAVALADARHRQATLRGVDQMPAAHMRSPLQP
ncbi:hypothetical protein AAY473_029778 [Plecturocebus cupreus]